ncbi:hypothetical protein T484DRAFT_1800010 [Baffinella frigidus]|nr:hypothetical protein T484DRAFT_1800010 [Cryptophyta sp. CCMP2293]
MWGSSGRGALVLSVMAACVSSAAAFTLPMLAAPVHGAFLGHSHARLASRCLRPGLKPQRPSPTLSLSASLAGVFDRNFAKSVADQARPTHHQPSEWGQIVVPSVAMVTPRGERNMTSRGTAFVVVPSVAMVTPRGVRNMTSRGTAFVVDVGAGV